jgi:hypothetical protein
MAETPVSQLSQALARHIATRDAVSAEAQRIAAERDQAAARRQAEQQLTMPRPAA